MISLRSVTKVFEGQNKVLDQLDLDVKRGDFLYLIGGSGAGKSTFLRLLATEESPSEGKVSVFGYALHQVSPSTLRAIRQATGYIPQGNRLISDLSVYDNIVLGVTLGGKRAWIGGGVKSRIQELVERLGLGPSQQKLAKNLSGGEAQRVAIARALVRNPELILADEPTGAQDGETTWKLMDLFLRANLNGATVILATHDRDIVKRVRKKALHLKDGKLTVEFWGEDALCGRPFV